RVGRMRLIRSGGEASFYVAEGSGAEFTLLHQCPFGEEDLKEIDLVGSTGGPQAALDIRFTDLRVRTNLAAPPADPADPVEEPASTSTWPILLVLAIVLSIAALAAWFLLLRRSRG